MAWRIALSKAALHRSANVIYQAAAKLPFSLPAANATGEGSVLRNLQQRTRGLYSSASRSNPERLVKDFESRPSSDLSDYIKALVRTEAQRVAAKDGVLSTASAVAAQKGQTREQLWRTLRVIAPTCIVMYGLNALVDNLGSAAQDYLEKIQDLYDVEEDDGDRRKGKANYWQPEALNDSTTKFSDVKGVDEAKAELEEIVMFLKDPKRFTRLGGKLPKGFMLVGPPGNGKTMLARSIAHEAGVNFFACSGSDFEDTYVGVGARRVRKLFMAAREQTPCIIFIDEIDAVAGNRNSKSASWTRQTLNQLLNELDGFKQDEGIIVIGATNFPESLDKALVRPGRIDHQVYVPNPDVEGRRQILESYMSKVKAKGVDVMTIARGTPGFSGADLANLVNTAAIKAAKDGAKAVTTRDLEFSKDKILMGSERKSAAISDECRRNTAYHEAGHALVAILTAGADPVHKATVVPRGGALGMVMQLPDKDEHQISREQMLARLDVCMGGRVAEELILGESGVTSGASEDLRQATLLAKTMVTTYGMSKRLGPFSASGYQERAMSTERRALIEQEVDELLGKAYGNAEAILRAHEKDLHALAKALIEHETLTGDQIKKIVGKGKPKSKMMNR